MSQAQVGLIGPRSSVERPEKPKKDDVDRILEGLQIANGVLGIGVNFSTIQNHRAQTQALEDARNGVVTRQQELDAGIKGMRPVVPGTEGAIAYKVTGDNGNLVDRAMIMPPKEAPPEKPIILPAGASLVQGGKITTTAPKARGDGDGGPPLVQVETVDKDGNPIITFVRKQEGAAYPTKGAKAKRPEDLNASDRQRFDSASMGLDAVKSMKRAFANGDNTFSVYGDNDYTAARAHLEEALGRMQSGGAISKDEAARFAAMAPTWRDSKKQQQSKLDWLETEMALRVKNIGFDPEWVTQQRANVAGAYATPEKPEEGTAIAAPAGSKPKPSAGSKPKPSADDNKAIQWLLRNPKDPRATKVHEALRAKDLIQ